MTDNQRQILTIIACVGLGLIAAYNLRPRFCTNSLLLKNITRVERDGTKLSMPACGEKSEILTDEVLIALRKHARERLDKLEHYLSWNFPTLDQDTKIVFFEGRRDLYRIYGNELHLSLDHIKSGALERGVLKIWLRDQMGVKDSLPSLVEESVVDVYLHAAGDALLRAAVAKDENIDLHLSSFPASRSTYCESAYRLPEHKAICDAVKMENSQYEAREEVSALSIRPVNSLSLIRAFDQLETKERLEFGAELLKSLTYGSLFGQDELSVLEQEDIKRLGLEVRSALSEAIANRENSTADKSDATRDSSAADKNVATKYRSAAEQDTSEPKEHEASEREASLRDEQQTFTTEDLSPWNRVLLLSNQLYGWLNVWSQGNPQIVKYIELAKSDLGQIVGEDQEGSFFKVDLLYHQTDFENSDFSLRQELQRVQELYPHLKIAISNGEKLWFLPQGKPLNLASGSVQAEYVLTVSCGFPGEYETIRSFSYQKWLAVRRCGKHDLDLSALGLKDSEAFAVQNPGLSFIQFDLPALEVAFNWNWAKIQDVLRKSQWELSHELREAVRLEKEEAATAGSSRAQSGIPGIEAYRL